MEPKRHPPEEVEEVPHEHSPDIENIMKKRWLSPEELAVYLGMSVYTIREKYKAGELPFSRIPGSHLIRFDRERIDRLLESGG